MRRGAGLLRMKRERRGFIAGGAKRGLNLRGMLDMRLGAFRAHCIHLRERLRYEILLLKFCASNLRIAKFYEGWV